MTPQEMLDEMERDVKRFPNRTFCTVEAAEILAIAQWVRELGERAEEAETERDEALAQLREERAVCICGCPYESHDSLGEDGEACDDETHECMRVAAGIAAAFVKTRQRAEKAEAEVAKLREALERTLGNFERMLSFRPVRDAAETIAEANAALRECEEPKP